MNRIALPYLEGFLFLSILLLSSCGSEPPPVDAPNQMGSSAGDLKVITTTGRMRAVPSPGGKVVSELARGQTLMDLGSVSNETTQITFGAEKFDEPWLEVEDSTGRSGWIYAREVAPTDPGRSLQEFRDHKLLQSIFGPTGFQRILTYRDRWQEARNKQELAEVYRLGLHLRDTLVEPLERKSYSYTRDPLPDLFWLEDYLPGYVPQLVAEGTVYYLFNDYEYWLERAKSSQGKQDDRYFQLMIRCFPEDSTEYFYPSWELQTWDYGGHSLLGRGIAYKILSGIEQIKAQTPLFSKELDDLKNRILSDLTRPDIHFWEPDSLVKRELDTIIQANWSIFTNTDRIALDTRRLQLDSASVNGIHFNARAGE